MIIDIFCSVDGNRDRWALCWRIARDLVQREKTVRLWIDDEHARRSISVYEVGYFPMYAENSAQWYGDTSATRGSLDRRSKVQVRPWPSEGKWLSNRRPPDVVIEAFGCGLPDAVAEEINRFPKPPLCIALQSFSSATHTYPKKSASRSGLLALPGVSVHVLNAGLWDDGLPGNSDIEAGVFDVAEWRTAFAEGWLRRPLGVGERLISMCAPTNPQALQDLYAILEQDSVPSVVLRPRCDPVDGRDWAFGIEHGPNVRSIDVGPLSQDNFDDLLKGCDVNFVCGEDAIARAWKSGRPWIWQELFSARTSGGDESGNLLRKLKAPATLLNIHAWWNGRPHEKPEVHDLFDRSLWPDVHLLGVSRDLVSNLLTLFLPLVEEPAAKRKRILPAERTSQEGGREHLPARAGYAIRDEVIESKILTVGVGSSVDYFHNAVLRKCELRVVRTTRQSMNFAATFEECDIRPKSPMKNKQMRDNIFLRCNFRGHYIGCDFGSWLEGSKGRAEDCDFSGCRLHLTRFFNSELSRLKLPGWPHVYLIGDSNGTWGTEWEKASAMLPLRLASLHKLGTSRKETVLAIHLPDFEIDAEAVWPLIQDMKFAWFPGKSDKPRAAEQVVAKLAEQNEAHKLQNQKNIERVAIWNLLQRSWLCSVRKQLDGSLELLFDTSFFTAKVPDAPAEVLVRLKEGSASLRGSEGATDVLGGSEVVEKFMLMGVGQEGHDVVLKPHRKERGQFKLSYASYEVFGSEGQPIRIDDLRRVAKAFWTA